jgi:beta-N-acetylhexosaminidase
MSARSLVLALAALVAASAAACLIVPRGRADAHRPEADRLLGSLGLEGEAAQVLLVGVSGKGAPSGASRELLGSMPLGGVLLFGLNLPDEPAGLGPFTAALQDASAGAALGIPLVVALDHEGGSVFRFRGSGITRLPPPLEVGARGPAYALALGKAAGRELRALGVNMNLAPVVELLDERNEAFLGSRSYGRQPERVDAAAGAFIEGLQSAGAAAVAKHFPGNAAADPHKGVAVLDIGKAEYERLYRPRFAAAARRDVAAVMISHAILPALDPERPATISRKLLADELRGRVGFRGLVLTDDLYMKALSGGRPPEVAAVEALAAGADLLMLSEGSGAARVRDGIVRAVKAGSLPRARLDDAARRVLELKLRFGLAEDLDPKIRAKRLEGFPALVAEDGRILAAALAKAVRR